MNAKAVTHTGRLPYARQHNTRLPFSVESRTSGTQSWNNFITAPAGVLT